MSAIPESNENVETDKDQSTVGDQSFKPVTLQSSDILHDAHPNLQTELHIAQIPISPASSIVSLIDGGYVTRFAASDTENMYEIDPDNPPPYDHIDPDDPTTINYITPYDQQPPQTDDSLLLLNSNDNSNSSLPSSMYDVEQNELLYKTLSPIKDTIHAPTDLTDLLPTSTPSLHFKQPTFQLQTIDLTEQETDPAEAMIYDDNSTNKRKADTSNTPSSCENTPRKKTENKKNKDQMMTLQKLKFHPGGKNSQKFSKIV